VKVSDFGIAKAVISIAGAAALGAQEQACLAPEVKNGVEPSAATDVFGLGAVLYEMLTGKSAAERFVAPSAAHPDATKLVDAILLRCLAAKPADRYATPEEVRSALFPLAVEAQEVPASQDFGMEIDVDIDLASSIAPPRPAPSSAAPPPAPGQPPRIGSRVSIHDEFRASQAGRPSLVTKQDADLAALLTKITENDAPRWMVVKDGLDHGPFSGRELVEAILKGDVVREHGLMNMDTGQRQVVSEYPEFTEFLDQFAIRKKEQIQREAVERSKKAERRSNLAKYMIAIGVMAVLGLSIGAYLWTRPESSEEASDTGRLAALYESGDIDIEGTAGILPDPPAGRRGSRGGHGSRSASRGNLSYEEAMNQAVDLGDVSQAGSERRLTSADVAGVMNRHINTLYRCVSQELRGGGHLGRVEIHLAIAGNGQVLGASAQQGSGGFRGCIEAKVRQVRFPTFPAPRMGARYYFNVD
jgi:hypothetical protein